MPEYLVEWRIEIVADTPREAALLALNIQRTPSSTAVVFDVIDEGATHQIDLLKENDND